MSREIPHAVKRLRLDRSAIVSALQQRRAPDFAQAAAHRSS